ncbi:MAG TPA: hypothetical protein VHO69_16425, partial [Phototrophicaceae bacterium]|nr:hypothetical protein [Phototrophicaceae bacterium]
NWPTQAIVRAQKAACREQYAELLAERDQAAPGVGFLALELHLNQLATLLQWIDRCEMHDQDNSDQ